MKKITLAYTGSESYYPTLDGLRGLAVLMILAYHLTGLTGTWMSVDLFFVISGFLISSILIDNRDKPHYFRNFYIKRIFRIFPLYYASLFLLAIIFTLAGIPFWKTGWSYFFYIQNWVAAFFQVWPEGWLASLRHFWTLSVEEQFYLFFPFVVYWVKPSHLTYVCVAGILASILCRFFFYYHHNQLGAYVFTLSRTDSLLCGVWAALRVRQHLTLRLTTILVSIVLMIAVWSVSTDLRHPIFQTVGLTVNSIFFSVVLLASLSPKLVISRLLQNKVLIGAGKISYGLYVFHYPFLILFKNTIPASAYQKLWIVVLTLISTLLLAILSYNYFEKKMMEMRKKYLR